MATCKQSVLQKKLRKTSVPYFNFLLQTANSQFRKAVCYDNKQPKEFCSFENSRSPAKIRNVSEKRSLWSPDDLDIIVSKHSKLLTATNSEVDYNFTESSKEALLTISEILLVEPGQLVTTCGRLTISPQYRSERHHDQRRYPWLQRDRRPYR